MLKLLYNLLLRGNHVHVSFDENNDYAAGTISNPFQIYQFIITWKTGMALYNPFYCFLLFLYLLVFLFIFQIIL